MYLQFSLTGCVVEFSSQFTRQRLSIPSSNPNMCRTIGVEEEMCAADVWQVNHDLHIENFESNDFILLHWTHWHESKTQDKHTQKKRRRSRGDPIRMLLTVCVKCLTNDVAALSQENVAVRCWPCHSRGKTGADSVRLVSRSPTPAHLHPWTGSIQHIERERAKTEK